jgi:hypothetical protein
VTSNIEHGGALDKAIARFGGMPGDWLDLSTGINPEHYPLPDIPAEVWNRLPDDRLLLGTCKLARDYYGLPEGAPIVAAPGTQALIQIIPSLTKPATVAILTPTYQEHAVSFAASGWQVVECAGIADIPDNATVAVIVNPNNPDGRVIAADELLALARTLGARGGFLVVDEAFADPHPEISAAIGSMGCARASACYRFRSLCGRRDIAGVSHADSPSAQGAVGCAWAVRIVGSRRHRTILAGCPRQRTRIVQCTVRGAYSCPQVCLCSALAADRPCQ